MEVTRIWIRVAPPPPSTFATYTGNYRRRDALSYRRRNRDEKYFTPPSEYVTGQAVNKLMDVQRKRAKVSVDTNPICLIKVSRVVEYFSAFHIALDCNLISVIIDKLRE